MPSRQRELFTVFLLLLSVALVYVPPSPQDGSILLAGDYFQLHARRMNFAREAIYGSDHTLPAWYPRELLGTPFRANIQNFPFIPSRLLVTLSLDPNARWTYPLMTMLSAMLAALFTFLFLRRLSFGLLASFVGGWTFACAGFYASRVAAGHLPLLEAYPSLPLLLWTIESFVQTRRRRWIVAIGISSACVALAGHPQLPIYSLAAGAVYAIVRASWRSLFAMTLGGLCAAFAWIPMLLLVGRSTRILSLAPAENDVSLPYSMLLNFFLPWKNGYAPPMSQANQHLFSGYPNWAYFWDTFCYVGMAPWIALVGLIFFARRSRVTIFMIALGIVGILFALPVTNDFVSSITSGATLIRSPARFLYFTGFALAVALAAFVHAVLPFARKEGPKFLLAGLLIAHAIDLVVHDRAFIQNQLGAAPTVDESAVAQLAVDSIGEHRAAIDYVLPVSANRTVDDIGAFDSILLARPYQFLIDAAGAQGDLNVQYLDGWQLSPRALKAAGVSIVVAMQDRPDLERIAKVGRLFVSRVQPTANRARFFPIDDVKFADAVETRRLLRDESVDLSGVLVLPTNARQQGSSSGSAKVTYQRISSDRIACDISASSDGFVRLIESFDPGWSATLDGKPTSIYPAWNALICSPVPAGTHHLEWVYRTPGAAAGGVVSIISLIGLIGLTAQARKTSA